jgi:hypothetical protein
MSDILKNKTAAMISFLFVLKRHSKKLKLNRWAEADGLSSIMHSLHRCCGQQPPWQLSLQTLLDPSPFRWSWRCTSLSWSLSMAGLDSKTLARRVARQDLVSRRFRFMRHLNLMAVQG